MGLKKFTGDVVKEGKRVRWPKREIMIVSVVTVLVIAIFAGVILWLEDWAGNTLLELLREAFSTLNK